MAGKTRMEAGPGISGTLSPLQCVGHEDPASGASGSEKISKKERKGKEPGMGEMESFATACLVCIHTWAFLPSSFQSSSLNPHPPACIRRLQGERWTWRWQGWCGTASPQELPPGNSINPCPVLAWPAVPFTPHAGVYPGPQKPERPVCQPRPLWGQLRMGGVAASPGSRRWEPWVWF